MVKSGLIYPFGMGFWGPNGHDGIWHLALAESLAKGSWQIPIFAGESINNYHVGFDLILAALSKLSFIPITYLYFQILPPIFALLIGYLTYNFVYLWRKSTIQAFWATFFTYFGGSFGWVVTLFRQGQIGGESLFWAQQSISTLINPPYALSLIFLLSGLILIINEVNKNNKNFLIAATFLFGLLVQIKVYAGVLALAGLLIAGFWQLIVKRSTQIIKVFVGAVIISILLFPEVTQRVNSEIIFKPFWFLEQMVSTTDRFYWPKFADAMINYKLAGNIIKGTLAYVTAFFIFIMGNFGTRIAGIFWYWQRRKKLTSFKFVDYFVITVIGGGLLIPMFFVQSGTAWNTIQFMYYSIFFLGIITGIWLGELLEKLPRRYVIGIAVVLVTLTIPTSIATLRYNYLPSRPPSKISKEELSALNFLRNQPDGIVLTLPFNKELAEKAIDNPPRPLYLYESTAYVSAFSSKQVYLEDQVNLEITGYPWKGRLAEVNNFLQTKNMSFLAEHNISYLYFVNPLNSYFKLSGNLENIYSNSEVNIYRVRNR